MIVLGFSFDLIDILRILLLEVTIFIMCVLVVFIAAYSLINCLYEYRDGRLQLRHNVISNEHKQK